MGLFYDYSPAEAKVAARRILKEWPDDLLALLDRVIDKHSFFEEVEFDRFCYNLRLGPLKKDGERTIKHHLEAIEIYPLLYFDYPNVVQGVECNKETQALLWQRIGEGKPLIPEVLAYYRSMGCQYLEEKHVRKAIHFDGPVHLYLFSVMAHSLPYDCFPRDRQELNFFSKLRENIGLALYPGDLRELTERFTKDPTTMRVDLSGFTYSHQESFKKKADELSFDTLKDTVKFLAENLSAYLVKDDQDRDIADKKYLAGKVIDSYELLAEIFITLTPSDLMDMNIRHHKNWTGISRSLKEFDEAHQAGRIRQWAEKYPKADAKDIPALGPYTITPLLTLSDIETEHEMLGGICIDTYGPDCIVGKSTLFSVRDKWGVSLSSFELDREDKLVQHKSIKNSEPLQDQKDAVAAYIAALEDGMLKENRLYSEWLLKASKFTTEEIHGYAYVPPLERAELAMQLLIENRVLPKALVGELYDRGILDPMKYILPTLTEKYALN